MSLKTETVGGVRLAFVDAGEGTPVLLIHGFPLDHTMWDAQIDALAGRHRVIAPDLRGFGSSEVTPGKVTMEQFVDDLSALLDARGIAGPAVICGLSMGGYVAWQFWGKYTKRVAALILCDTRAAADTPEAAAGRLQTADCVLREGPRLLADAMLPKLLAPSTLAERPELAQDLRRVIERTDPRGIAAALRGMAERPDVTGRLAEIACPALLIVGREDAITAPQEMGTIARAVPGARLVEVAGAGHMSPVERPQEVSAAMLEFLAALA
jgi:3-oxoadipate enol-lactonase